MWKKYKALDVVSKSLGLNLIFARLSLVALPETCIPISASVGLPRLGPKIKTAVMGILERGGEIRVGVVGNRRKKEMHGEINRHVAAGSAVYTDAFMSYVGLKKQGFAHQIIDHADATLTGRFTPMDSKTFGACSSVD